MTRALIDNSPDAAGPSAVRWIAFDAVGTLIVPDPPVAVAYCRVGRRYGSRRTEGEIAARFQRVYGDAERDRRIAAGDASAERFTSSEAAERRFWQRIVGAVLDDVQDPAGCFRELFEHFGRPTAWRCFDDVGPALRELERRGYDLAAASNFDRRLGAICDGLAELRPLKLRVISSLVGWRKPSPEFYQALVSAAKCRPHELLMVGDDLHNDVLAARAAGLQALRLVRGGHPRVPGIVSKLQDLLQSLPAGKDFSNRPAQPSVVGNVRGAGVEATAKDPAELVPEKWAP